MHGRRRARDDAAEPAVTVAGAEDVEMEEEGEAPGAPRRSKRARRAPASADE